MDNDARRRRQATAGSVAGLLLAALVVGRLVLHRVFGVDLPDLELPGVDLPDVKLPGWLRWLGPLLGVAKLLLLVGLGVLAVLGERERRRRAGKDPQ